MKKFIINLTKIITLLVILLKSIDFTKKYYYGNHYFNDKINLFNKEYNTVFFGSSRVHNQINPTVFDSITKLKSYNLGAQACFNPESYYLAENFIHNQDKNQIKFLFLELQKLSDIDPKNSRTVRGYYWNSLTELAYVFEYLQDNTYLSLNKKIKIASKYSISFLYKQFDFTRLSLINSKKNKKNTDRINGFRPLTKQLKDESSLEKYHQVLKNYKKDIINYKSSNSAHIDRLNYIVELGKNKGIDVYFILPPKWNNYNFALEIINKIDNDKLIDLTKSHNIEQYYLPKYSSDAAHFNIQGANMFTEDLANIFIQKSYFLKD